MSAHSRRPQDEYLRRIAEKKAMMQGENAMLSKTSAFVQAMGYPQPPPGMWSTDGFKDVYTYTYNCGHQITVPGTGMQAGQVIPPICPTCHTVKVDQMEADNWRRDPKWKGYSVYKQEAKNYEDTGSFGATLGSAMSWLDSELGRVKAMAWR